jgi:hypothetical protein
MQLRVDLYGTVHKALRARLFDLGTELDRCDFANTLEVAVALSAYRRAMGFVHEHHQHEEHFIEPALRTCGADIAGAITTQHSGAQASLAELDDIAATIERSPEARRGAGAQLCARYRAFLADYLDHMDYEETAVNRAMWATFTDQELIDLRGRLQASIPLPRFIEWLEILLPAINVEERTAMLRGIKTSAPEPAFLAVTALASRVLGPTAWDAVRERLG